MTDRTFPDDDPSREAEDPILWRPHPLNAPQRHAYDSAADELYYGGRAGGGKSDLLLGLACTRHRRSLILRREATQLVELVERSREILDGCARYNATARLWREIPGDRMLEFGGCEWEADKRKYKGRAHDLKGFDEVSDFTESQYLFLGAWNRTTIPAQRCRVVATGNPPTTSDGEWVLRRWSPWLDPQDPYPAVPGELRWYVRIDGKEVARETGEAFLHLGEALYPRSRTFIPASLHDNPYLANTGYAATLQALPEPLRSQLLYGDFTATREDDPWQVIPTEWIRAAQARWTDGPPGPAEVLGVDVARGGSDRTVVAARHGRWFAPLLKVEGKRTPDGPSAAGLVASRLEERTRVHLDVIGVGASVYDVLKSQHIACWPVNFAAASKTKDRSGQLHFANLRAEGYWRFREALDPILGEGIALPRDPELLADLCAPRWAMTLSGLRIEPKEEIVHRLGRSPDCADAVVLAAMHPRKPEVHVFDY